MSDWQPIETAPTDGSKILIWDEGMEYPEAAFWQEHDEADAEEIGEPGFWCYACDVLSDVAQPDNPIGWMPLPASPEGTQ